MSKTIDAKGNATEVDYLWSVTVFDPENQRTQNIVAQVVNISANGNHDAEYEAMQMATGAKYPRRVRSMAWSCNNKLYECLTIRTSS